MRHQRAIAELQALADSGEAWGSQMAPPDREHYRMLAVEFRAAADALACLDAARVAARCDAIEEAARCVESMMPAPGPHTSAWARKTGGYIAAWITATAMAVRQLASRGSSRGSAPPETAAASKDPRNLEREKGLEPSTSTLARVQPIAGDEADAEKQGDSGGDGSATDDAR